MGPVMKVVLTEVLIFNYMNVVCHIVPEVATHFRGVGEDKRVPVFP